ncbi:MULTISPECIES: ABC transporter ATP-binding protein [Paenibacillus]|uniref:ATP-binding cassette domain-containing protein n=1 Tax=Paenibacillus campinasensis TaxID=66347 RepID=A0ABW9SXN2_9BACL|nr:MULTISPECIES: ABC transporter ATP-binding protein [Paenibacillus]MUG65203.1 ATP-binding cassette domain-containing protein [Paenibacillus campinasensis]PAK52456.1 peptide ABC transporter ATP-binding protein [Paenibacillus sp. 7541]
MKESSNVLEINNLQTSFFTKQGEVKAVDDVSLKVRKGKTLGIVGESGSGKSILSLSILRLIFKPGQIVSGEIIYNGENLLDKPERYMRGLRGNQISMIFQEPMTSLNPVFTIGEQIAEAYRIHEGLGSKEALRRTVDMLRLVGIPSPEKRARQYPFQLSGGMRQRVMIAMALACNPDLLIADEPTTALDVTIQAQILELMKELQQKLHMSIIMITHDLGIVAETCDDVAVMYCGKIVEYADVRTLFRQPKHPYTIGLLNSLPRHDIDQEELEPITGSVPSPFEERAGCSFAPRCPHAAQQCYEKLPDLKMLDSGQQQVRCWMYTDQWESGTEVHGES